MTLFSDGRDIFVLRRLILDQFLPLQTPTDLRVANSGG